MEKTFEMSDNWGKGITCLLLGIFMAVQLALVFFMQKTVDINTDGIFSYTLANNPYTYVFVDDIYEEFPNTNGWIDAAILRENYMVEAYDRFNYAAVYHHQRHDVHPPLYYFAVHTVSSFFPGTYSNLYTLGINLAALFLSDIIMIYLFRMLYGSCGYSVVPMTFLILMESMRFLFTWARMYMMLFLFCAWYLYIHARLLRHDWQRADLLKLSVCIFLGTLTHYYFYVFAGALTLFAVIILLRNRRARELLRYIYFGAAGLMVSWICYPWFFFHIFLNEQGKHQNIEGWSLDKVKEYLLFLRKMLFDDRNRGWVVLLALWCVWLLFIRNQGTDEKDGWRTTFRRMTAGSGLLYSLVIYTLDGGNRYYLTAFYLTFIVWASMLLIDSGMGIRLSRGEKTLRIGMAVIGVWLVCSGSVIGGYLSNAQRVVTCMSVGEPLADDFHQTPVKCQNYNCLYIEKKQDNLFHNYWFDFGQYRMFKKLSMEQFALRGIRKEDLQGCGQGGDGILVYAPKECSLNEQEYSRIAEDANYVIYRYVGGNDE